MTPVSLFVACTLLVAQAEPTTPSVFELPRIQAQFGAAQQRITGLFRDKKYVEAERELRECIKLVPHDSSVYYNLACALARQEKLDDAMKALADAVDHGFNAVEGIKADEDLAALRVRPEFTALLTKAATAKPTSWKYSPKPAEIVDGVAMVSEKNTGYQANVGVFGVLLKFAEKPAVGDPVRGFGEAGELVRKWYGDGTAAGNHGDLYDNHDTDHSNMDYDSFPQLTRIEFDEAVKARNLHHGLQLLFLFNRNAPTIGNSSTALVSGPFWRCQVRSALTQPRGPQLLYLQYASNHIYFYPEHRDHDPGHNGAGDGYGDVMPANTPYYLLSQGSSGSDRPLMHAVALILAAFRPEVKAELIKQSALAPTVQMIFRRGYMPVEQADDYFTGKAHPTAFDGDKLNLVKMVTLAHEMMLESLPPIAQIQMVKEDDVAVGIDYFDVAPRERLFDTPSAIARIAKSTRYERTMIVTAERSRALHGEPLKYRWHILRGDPKRISIEPIAEGQAAQIRVKHHPRMPVLPGSTLESNRVDIGCFAENAQYASAPAFVSILYLDNEKREYDDANRISVVDYAEAETAQNYVDPLLDFKKNWRDEYHYDERGRLTGWTRKRGEERQEFTREGTLVTKTDNLARPTEAHAVRYEVQQGGPDQSPQLIQIDTNTVVNYGYASGEDRIGERAK